MKKKKIDLLPYVLLIPTFVGITVFSFWPFLKTVICSFSVTDEFGNWIRWEGTYFWKELFVGEEGLFATMMKNVNAPATDKQKLIGHSKFEMTAYYTHTDIESLKAITDNI